MLSIVLTQQMPLKPEAGLEREADGDREEAQPDLDLDAHTHAGLDIEHDVAAQPGLDQQLHTDRGLNAHVHAGLDNGKIDRAVDLADHAELALDGQCLGIGQILYHVLLVGIVGIIANRPFDNSKEGEADPGLERTGNKVLAHAQPRAESCGEDRVVVLGGKRVVGRAAELGDIKPARTCDRDRPGKGLDPETDGPVVIGRETQIDLEIAIGVDRQLQRGQGDAGRPGLERA